MDNALMESSPADNHWRHVLTAYVAEHNAQKTLDPENDGWLSRLKQIDGVQNADLPVIHGKLIAYGYLQFQLAGRAEGVQYKVSSFGREALAGGKPSEAA